MFWVRFRSILGKELIEIRRGTGWLWLLGILVSPFMEWQIVSTYVAAFRSGKLPPGPAAEHMLALAVTLTLLLIGPFTVPQWATTSLNRGHTRDQIRGTLVPLLCTGVPPGLYWLGRVIAAFLFSYMFTLLSVAVDALMIQLYFKIPLVLKPSIWAAILVSAPIASLVLPAAMFLLSWASRTTSNVTAFLPTIVLLGGWIFFLVPSRMPLNPLAAIHVSAVVGIGLTVAMAWIANRIRRDRIVGLSG